MGFRRLEIVKPPTDWTDEAQRIACGDMEVLGNARVHSGLDEALADKQLIVGTTRRRGKGRGFFLPFKEGLEKISRSAVKNQAAILFGREPDGLSSRELEACSFLVTIPSDHRSSSLNLSQSVMLVAYELSGQKSRGPGEVWVQHRETEVLYDRIRSTLRLLGYSPEGDKDMEESIMLNIRKMIGRAGLTEWERQMILGLCTQIEKKIEKPFKKTRGDSEVHPDKR